VRLYENLFTCENPNDDKTDKDYTAYLNPKSLEILKACQLEPSLAKADLETRYQFERLGYFCLDLDSRPEALVFNRTVTLRDQLAKIEQKKK